MSKKPSLLKKELKDIIRLYGKTELGDAIELACLFRHSGYFVDKTTSQGSVDLCIAMALSLAHIRPDLTLGYMVNLLHSPAWGTARELFDHYMSKYTYLPLDKDSAEWFERFSKGIIQLNDEELTAIVDFSKEHWERSFSKVTEIPWSQKIQQIKKPRRSIQVFNTEKVEKAKDQLLDISEEKRGGADRILEKALLNSGYRKLPDMKKIYEKLENTKQLFENLAEPISRLQYDLILSEKMSAEEFYVKPILLLGEPGIGKTYLASQLADALGVEMEKMSAGSAQGGFQLNGSHSGWTNAKYGAMASLMARSAYASPVVVIDEVDKIPRGTAYPVMPVLLDLLEVRSASLFRDEFMQLEFDCSKVIFVLTANYIEDVPPPLLSRVNVFNIPNPGPEQRMRIIRRELSHWQKKTRHNEIDLEMGLCEKLANRVDIDLRKMTDIVREGFARAIGAGTTSAKLLIPENRVRQIGF